MIDPCSIAVQLGRLDLAVHGRRSADVASQVRLLHALEEGRMRLVGRTLDPKAAGFISADDARIAVIAHVVEGKFHEDAGSKDQAIEAYERGLSIARRVPLATMAALAQRRYETPLCCQLDLGPETRAGDFRALLHETNRACAEKLLAGNNEAAAVPYCQAMLCLHPGPDPDSVAEQIVQRICRKLGAGALGALMPATAQSDFAGGKAQRRN